MPVFESLAIVDLEPMTTPQFEGLELSGDVAVQSPLFGEEFDLEMPTITLNSDNTLLGIPFGIDRLTFKYPNMASVYAPVTVSMSCEEGTQIRYTLSSKSPTHTAYLYTEPLSLVEAPYGYNVTIKARAYRQVNGKPSPNEKSPVVIANFAVKKV